MQHLGGKPRHARTGIAALTGMAAAVIGTSIALARDAHALPRHCGVLRSGLTHQQAEKFTLATGECGEPALPAWRRDPIESDQLHLYDRHRTGGNVSKELTPQEEPETPSRQQGSPPVTQPRALPPRLQRALKLAPEVDAVASRHGVDPLLLHAIASVESAYQVHARSRVGARGLMQVMPATARRFGVTDPAALENASTNLAVSASYLKTLQRRFGNDLPLVLAGYNAGEGAVERYGRRIPPYAETRRYVRDVLARYEALTAAARSTEVVQ